MQICPSQVPNAISLCTGFIAIDGTNPREEYTLTFEKTGVSERPNDLPFFFFEKTGVPDCKNVTSGSCHGSDSIARAVETNPYVVDVSTLKLSSRLEIGKPPESDRR